MERPSFNWKRPLLLYLLTWVTTSGFRLEDGYFIYQFFLAIMTTPLNPQLAAEEWSLFMRMFSSGMQYSAALMLILTCHEFGHYFQMRRYRISGSLPYFIPMPFGPIGTLGAVIAMDGRIPNRRALFDIGVSGPLAGLVPTMFCLYYGIKWSHVGPISGGGSAALEFGEPLLFQWYSWWIYGPLPGDMTLFMHPVAKAAWVGLLLTSLNLMPFSQLDGGHVFYALLGPRAERYSWGLFSAIILLVAFNWSTLWHWTLILILLGYIGVSHPPTADDRIPLTSFRRLLGCCTLGFIILGFTPVPIVVNESDSNPQPPHWYCMVPTDDENVFSLTFDNSTV